MATDNRNLNDLFASARSEDPVVSHAEIDSLLDTFDLHGRQIDEVAGAGSKTAAHQSLLQGKIFMGILSTLVLGAVVGTGALLSSGDEPVTRAIAAPASEWSVPVQNGPETPAVISEVPAELTAPTTPVSLVANTINRPPLSPIAPPALLNGGGDEEISEEASRMGEELGRFISDYWDGKINEYRRAIDQAVSAEDRAQLNRLRVRWSLVDEDDHGPVHFNMSAFNGMSANGNGVNHGFSVSSNGVKELSLNADLHVDHMDGEMNTWTPEHLPEGVKVFEAADGKSIIIARNGEEEEIELDGADGHVFVRSTKVQLGDLEELEELQDLDEDVIVVNETDEDGNQVQKVKIVKRIVANRTTEMKDLEVELSEVQKALEDIEVDMEMHLVESREQMRNLKVDMAPFNMGSMGEMLKSAISADQSESSKILVETWAIAARNRAKLDPLKERIMNDIAQFETDLKQKVRALNAELDNDLPAELIEAMHEHESMMDHSIAENVLGPLYDVIAEPILMLYNGSDITPMLTSAIAAPMPGVKLDAGTSLAQSYPNPAQADATIEFTLASSSSNATLRLYDVTGSELLNRDLGTLSAGTHSEVIDVSTLPSGTYLYHLTVEGPEGSRVYSKSLEVQN